ncbi:scramblase family protein, putative [Ichthyophthirius multifiliis]|uniref:Phospholipid scramblase n=1 Tax=Ichthyophthirius multifiliis TaxID=5932 RepID=G0QQT5_ICHMU|nr:scramblase family protein, putative [Ichthyophthirius multifiliis]EGR32419.1 scramblase family protein, putative [Ichthyophthirius multifiliis]|eukprot:XP_004036405.1 scramblase family protein, putative [Ichthyophthirius multifiliis]
MKSLDLIQQVLLIQQADPQERFNPCIFPLYCSCGLCFVNCCEQENIYQLIKSDENFEHREFIYKFTEEKKFFLQKCCFPPSHRSLEIKGENIYKETIIQIEKPFKCTFLCFARPQMLINYKNLYIGKVLEPFTCQIFTCLFHELEIYDKNDSLSYLLKAQLFQGGVFCASCFGNSCQIIEYNIFNRNDEKVGSIKHIFDGLQKEYCTKADKFGITFPFDATVEEKVLIICATILIDYLLFENF